MLAAGAEIGENGTDAPVGVVVGGKAELGEDRRRVLAGRALAEEEPASDPGLGQALGHQREHRPFPLGERGERICPRGPAVTLGDPRLVANLVDNALRHNVAGSSAEIRAAMAGEPGWSGRSGWSGGVVAR
jgi:hypothetical protein